MDHPPSFDRSLLLPIGVGVFSLIGMCVILVLGRMNSDGAVVEEIPTATAFQYAFIGTEPAISTLTGTVVDEEEISTPTAGAFPTAPPETPVIQATNTSPPIITLPPLENTNTPTRTQTSESAAPFGAGTFDNTDSRFLYSGEWGRQTGVSGAYQNTLEVSGTLGSSVTFRFIGNELRVFFQAAPSLGTIRLTLDGTNYDMPQSSSTTQIEEWVLSTSTAGTHTVTISHVSGGSVNFDSIIVPVVPTPSPNTATPTNTSTTN
jgi:hypothetical protein